MTRLSPKDAELYTRTDEVLHYLWDPIGVSECPEARDEYSAYFPHVFSMLSQNNSADEIAAYLVSIEQDSMGLAISEESRKRVMQIAELLIEYKSLIDDRLI